MTFSVIRLSCQSGIGSGFIDVVKECYNPHFFAYGQLPLYVARIFLDAVSIAVPVLRSLTPLLAAYSLRFISAVASIVTGFVLYLLVRRKMGKSEALLALILYIFTPGLIQSAHFGTTESLLTMFFMLVIYFRQELVWTALFIGMAVATKVSALAFLALPLYDAVSKSIRRPGYLYLGRFVLVAAAVVLFAVLFSPHYVISFSDFLKSMDYEGRVATGTLKVFYTEQFEGTVPIVFQLVSIFPYAAGIPLTVLALVGWVVSLKNRDRYLPFAFLVLFLSNSLLYAKWTRFMTPVIPLMIYFAVLLVKKLNRRHGRRPSPAFLLAVSLLVGYQMFAGLSMLGIYLRPDVRAEATEWIKANIPAGSRILSESANVVDIPLDAVSRYRYVSAVVHEMDNNPEYAGFVRENLRQADYVFVPSRRVYANYSCYQPSLDGTVNKIRSGCDEVRKKFPRINEYYDTLFRSGQYELVKTFRSLPGFKDEQAEESWTVFDHPVVRIYRRVI